VNHPPIRYAKTRDGVHLAFQVLGESGPDFVYLAPWFSHLEVAWDEPRKARFLLRLASFSRLVLFDRRGQGLSDPEADDRVATFETRCDDILAVMDAIGSSRAVVYGASETGPMAALFAALHPERTLALVLHGTDPARSARASDWSMGETAAQHAGALDLIDRLWGTEAFVRAWFPALSGDQPLVEYIASLQRHSMSPGAAMTAERWRYQIDVRDALPSIHVPALILNREEDDPLVNQYFADHIAGSRHVLLPGREHIPYLGDQDSVTASIERFVESVVAGDGLLDRGLRTVVCVAGFAASPGPRARGAARVRRASIDVPNAVSSLVTRYRGRVIDVADGRLLAIFDGPTRALTCAVEAIRAGGRAGHRLRAGVHAGEVSVTADQAVGSAGHIAAELAARAGPSQVLASQTVKDLTIGSSLDFERDRDFHPLDGREVWRTYRVHAPAGSRDDPAASRTAGDEPPQPPAPRLTPRLTARERQVLDLLAAGRSDGEIAEALFISPKTASVHVSNIKGKLGARTRVETAIVAQRLGLVNR
jgi:pimeloyl-ACP methyl ester carboxylesterase/DNA-binding CsgD family transcriptional regulator/class 3 adenylate cyclase